MRTFDPDLLRTLVAVAESGSLTAAAPRLFRSQSAVSEQLRKLEEACGTTLCLRGKRGAELTAAGQKLLGHAREILAAHDRAARAMQGLELAGTLRLAVTDYFHPRGIAPLLRQLRRTYPELQLHVAIRKSASIEEDADNADFDVGLSMRILERGRGNPIEADTRRVALFRERMAWVVDPDLPDASSRTIPLVVLPESCAVHRFVVRTLRTRDIPYYVAHSASGVAGLQLAISAGLGVSCLNASAIPPGAQAVRSFAGIRLPSLPEVEFGLLVPAARQQPLADDVVQLLARTLRTPLTAMPQITNALNAARPGPQSSAPAATRTSQRRIVASSSTDSSASSA